MKRSILIASVWVVAVLMNALPASASIPTEFGGIPWATSLERVADCETIDSRGDLHYCVRPGQPHLLMGKPIARVTYGFYKKAFFAVFIRIDDDEAYYQIKQRLIDQLGRAESEIDKDGGISTLRWTTGQVQIELINPSSETGLRLAYYYLPLADKARAERAELFPPRRSKAKLFPGSREDDSDSVRILEIR